MDFLSLNEDQFYFMASNDSSSGCSSNYLIKLSKLHHLSRPCTHLSLHICRKQFLTYKQGKIYHQRLVGGNAVSLFQKSVLNFNSHLFEKGSHGLDLNCD